MPSTKNKLRVGRYKRGRPPQVKPFEKEPITKSRRGRPPSAHLFFSDTQKYLALAWKIFLDCQTAESRGKAPLSDAAYVRRNMRKSHIEAERRNRRISISVEKIQSEIDAEKDLFKKDLLIQQRETLKKKTEWVQVTGRMFRPSGPGNRWADKDFKHHVQYETTYRHVCRYLKKIRADNGVSIRFAKVSGGGR